MKTHRPRFLVLPEAEAGAEAEAGLEAEVQEEVVAEAEGPLQEPEAEVRIGAMVGLGCRRECMHIAYGIRCGDRQCAGMWDVIANDA